ncbi:M20/M25/M40 family metallo-hydrolase [Paractinoplanes globisporus]|uniref:M20/M25/M40 family metallo-hydrolase n=1 Tax=Paractinoplanes globisporus TaxID=113565 RepID=A0ABW6WYQ1_9ACTN|nr:M20/M25/M40 family metallo-hydrolase [Actinoplanes globisporus]
MMESADRVVARTVELAEIPAPSGHEQARAARVAEWWRSDGLAEVHADAVGNLWARVRDGAGSAVVLAAHLDTVFDADTDHTTRRDGTRLLGPGVGDNTVAVAALAELHALLPPRTRRPVWIVATVAEEGLGNLAGAIEALRRPAAPIGAFIAVEGNYLDRIATRGVGSARSRITVSGPGGHAWERAAAPSAVHGAVALAAEALKRLPPMPQTSVNVGRIGGGEAINARARECWFEIDLRAIRPQTLAWRETALAEAIRVWRNGPDSAGLKETITDLGRRPAGEIPQEAPLVRAAESALRKAGRDVNLVAASTDANAAYEAGVPAIAIGVTTGAGEHTEQEWIELADLPVGLTVLADTVAELDDER